MKRQRTCSSKAPSRLSSRMKMSEYRGAGFYTRPLRSHLGTIEVEVHLNEAAAKSPGTRKAPAAVAIVFTGNLISGFSCIQSICSASGLFVEPDIAAIRDAWPVWK